MASLPPMLSEMPAPQTTPLRDESLDPSALSATRVADDVGLGATMAAAGPEIPVLFSHGGNLEGLGNLPASIVPESLAQSMAETGTPRITLNSSVLPRVTVQGETLLLSSSTGPRYATVRELGKGGMGEVDLVEDRDIGRAVAVKRLLAGQTEPASLARFVDEVHTVGRLEHPNIVPIHDVGIDERGRFFFVMKYVDGETLETIVDKLRAGDADYLRRFDLSRRVQIFEQILRALEFAHARGVIHRDIKPANVMVGRFGEVVLMDWGVARSIGPGTAAADAAAMSAPAEVSLGRASTTRVGALVGTPLYMSPEQARGDNDQLDARSDLYSAALVFHEMLTLEHLRAHHKTLPALLHAAQSEAAPSSGAIFAKRSDAGIGAEYAHYLNKALQLAPDARFRNATEMLETLRLVASGRFQVQCPVTFMKRASLALSGLVDRAPWITMAAALGTAAFFLVLLARTLRDLLG
jgi:serine/threonine-protein kinase